MKRETCAQCGYNVMALSAIPAPDDEYAWRKIAAEHASNCRWALTRSWSAQCPSCGLHRSLYTGAKCKFCERGNR